MKRQFELAKEIKGNQRGGRRPGAGRKKGSLTKRTQEIVAATAASGETPLEYLLRVMRTNEDEDKRIDAAKAAAPYVHPRLSSVEAKMDANVNATVKQDAAEEIARRLGRIATGGAEKSHLNGH